MKYKLELNNKDQKLMSTKKGNKRTINYETLTTDKKPSMAQGTKNLDWGSLLKEIIKNKKNRENALKYKSRIEDSMRANQREREAEFEGNIISLAYKNGCLAAGGSSSNIQLAWVSKDNISPFKVLEGHSDMVTCLEFGDSSLELFSGGADNRLIFWRDCKMFQVFQDCGTTIRGLSWNQNTKILACGSQQENIFLYNIESGSKKLRLAQKTKANSESLAIGISPNSEFMASGGYNSNGYNSLFVFKFNNSSKKFSIMQQEKSPLNKVITCLRFSGDSKTLLTGTRHYTCYIWKYSKHDRKFEQHQSLTHHSDYLKSVFISQNGSWIITGSDDKTIKKYCLQSNGKFEIQKSYSGFRGEVWDAIISDDDKYIITSSMQPEVKIYPLEEEAQMDTKKSERVALLGNEQDKPIMNLKISEDGELMITNNITGIFKIFEKTNGRFELLQSLKKKEISERPLFPIGISYDNLMFMTSINGKVSIYSKISFTPKKCIKNNFSLLDSLTASDCDILTLTFFKKSYSFVTGAKDKKIKIWYFEKKLKKYNIRQVILSHRDWIFSLHVSQDDQILVSGSLNNEIQVFLRNGNKFNLFQKIESQSKKIRALITLKSGKILIAASDDKTIRTYFRDKNEGFYNEIQEFKNVHEETYYLFKSKNEKYLLSKGMKKGTMRIWGITSSGILPLTQLNAAVKVAVEPNFENIFQVKQELPSVTEVVALTQGPVLDEDFKLQKIIRNLFKAQEHGYNNFMVKEVFQDLFLYLKSHQKGHIDTRLQDNFLIHCKVNILLLCILSGFSDILRTALKEFGYNPFFYRDSEFDPLKVAVKLDNTACLDVLADFFKMHKLIFQLVITEKFFYECMKTSSKNFKSFVISIFFSNTKSYKMEIHTEFPIGSKNYEYFEANSRIVENSLYSEMKRKSGYNRNKGHLPEVVNFFVTSLPTDLSISCNSTYYILKAFSYFSNDQKMGKFRFYIKEIWMQNLGKLLVMSLVKIINFGLFTILFVWKINLLGNNKVAYNVLKWLALAISSFMFVIKAAGMAKAPKKIFDLMQFLTLVNLLVHFLGPILLILDTQTSAFSTSSENLVKTLSSICMLSYGLETTNLLLITKKFRTIFGIFQKVIIESIWLFFTLGFFLCLLSLLNLNIDKPRGTLASGNDYANEVDHLFNKVFALWDINTVQDYNELQYTFHILTVMILAIITPAYLFATVISIYNHYHNHEELNDLNFIHMTLLNNSYIFSIFKNLKFCKNRSEFRKNYKHFLTKRDLGDTFKWRIVKQLRDDMDSIVRKADQIEAQGGRMKESLNRLSMGHGTVTPNGLKGSRRTNSQNGGTRMIGGKSLDGINDIIDIY